MLRVLFVYTSIIIWFIPNYLIIKSAALQYGRGCKIPVDNNESQPFIMSPGSTFVYHPNTLSRIYKYPYIDILPTMVVAFSCPGNSIELREKDTGLTTVNGTCISRHEETNYAWTEITCKTDIISRFYIHGGKCGKRFNGMKISVAFYISQQMYIKVFCNCYDKLNSSPLYSYHLLRRRYVNFQYSMVDPSPYKILQEAMFGLAQTTIANKYKIAVQRSTINELVNIEQNSTRYIKTDPKYALDPTFLTPPSDFFYLPYRLSTHRYTNAAPQWRIIKHGNWKNLEQIVQKFSLENNLDLRVWTGIHGTATLPYYVNDNKNSSDLRRIYLYKNNNILKMPIPAMFWKIILIHQETTDQCSGIALIVLNNPYEYNVRKRLLCRDKSELTGWVWPNSKMAQFGYSYACEIKEFVDVVEDSPRIRNCDLLHFIKAKAQYRRKYVFK